MSNKEKCPVCEKQNATNLYRDGRNARIHWTCQNCGDYLITGSAVAVLESGWLGDRQLLAHWIRKRTNTNAPTFVNDSFMELVRDGKFPSAHEQRDNLLVAIGDSLKYPGDRITIDADGFQAVTGAATAESFEWLLMEFLSATIVSASPMGPSVGRIRFEDATLTLKGWTEYFELKRSDKQSRLAFMAMPFGNADIDDVVNKYFKPAVARAGFELRDVTEEQPAGLIDDHIRVGIRRSRLMLCELTHDNRGAYWEAGFAEGLGIPVIYTCREDMFSKIHFDTSHLNTIVWSSSNLEAAASRLTATIRATLPMEAKMEDDNRAA